MYISLFAVKASAAATLIDVLPAKLLIVCLYINSDGRESPAPAQINCCCSLETALIIVSVTGKVSKNRKSSWNFNLGVGEEES